MLYESTPRGQEQENSGVAYARTPHRVWICILRPLGTFSPQSSLQFHVTGFLMHLQTFIIAYEIVAQYAPKPLSPSEQGFTNGMFVLIHICLVSLIVSRRRECRLSLLLTEFLTNREHRLYIP